jgi:hypothetical protein
LAVVHYALLVHRVLLVKKQPVLVAAVEELEA